MYVGEGGGEWVGYVTGGKNEYREYKTSYGVKTDKDFVNVWSVHNRRWTARHCVWNEPTGPVYCSLWNHIVLLCVGYVTIYVNPWTVVVGLYLGGFRPPYRINPA